MPSEGSDRSGGTEGEPPAESGLEGEEGAEAAIPENGAQDGVPDESDFGEPPCAVPVDIGWNPEPSPPNDDFSSTAHDAVARGDGEDAGPPSPGVGTERPQGGADLPDGTAKPPVEEDLHRLLVEQIRKENLSLAAALEKAKEWTWSDGKLCLSFGSEYEAAVAKNEAETIRRAAAAAGLPAFALETETVGKPDHAAGREESPRVALVRRVFRGQVMKG